MLEDLARVRMRALALTAVMALALGATACGSDDDGSDAQAGDGSGSAAGDAKKQLEADYDRFVDDIYKGRWEQACRGYSSRYVKLYPRQIKIADTCVKTMRSEFKQVSVQPRPWVDRVRLQGSTKAVGYAKTRPEGVGVGLRFVKEDGVWRIDGALRKPPPAPGRS